MDINQLQTLTRLQQLLGAQGAGVSPTPYDPTGNAQVQPDTPNMQAPPGYDPAARMKELYQPSTAVNDQYKAALGAMPQREDPSTRTSIVAKLQGLAAGTSPATYQHGAALGLSFDPSKAMNTEDQVANQGYYKKLGDWTNQTGVLQKGATEEDKSNQNNRIAATQTVSSELRAKQQEEKERNDKEREKVSKQRADAYEFKQTHPQWKPYAQKGGTLFYINPENPMQKYDTGILTNTLSDQDRLDLVESNKQADIAASGDQQRLTEADKEKDRQKDITARGQQSIDLKTTPPGVNPKGAGANKPDSPSQQKVAQYNKASKALLEHPEWAPYIELNKGGTNSVNVAPPATGNHWWSQGTPPDVYKAISDYMLKDSGTTPTTPVTPAAPKVNKPMPGDNGSPDNAKLVKVVGPAINGKPQVGYVPVASSKKLPAGWSIVDAGQ